MTNEMKRTELPGFPVQYEFPVVDVLNRTYNKRCLNQFDLEEVGKAVSKKVLHSTHDCFTGTKDGYWWFGGLEFSLSGAKIRVLFPWAQDFKHPISQLDRSVNVYSDKPVPPRTVKQFLEKLAYNLELRCMTA